MRRSTRGRRLGAAVGVVLALGVLAAVAFGPYLLGPRTEALSGDWSARAFEGRVVADRALVGGGNTALDLRTGKSVRLGSVVGGTAFYADGRLVVVKGERVDSVALDASARWTWRAAAGHRVIPLAAARGSTLLADCASVTADRCRLVGIDRAGKQDWEAPDAQRPVDPPQAALPQVHASKVDGGGVLVTDPVSGRSSLEPGSRFAFVPDGPVVVTVEQDGQCVVSLYAAADPLWTRVLGPCPNSTVPGIAVSDGVVALTWPGRTERLSAATGATVAPSRRTPIAGVVGRTGSLVATQEVHQAGRTDLVRHGRDSHVLQLRHMGTGDVVAQLVTHDSVALLALEPDAVVVREGGRVVRYTVDS